MNKNMCEVCNNHSGKCCGRFHQQYCILRWVLIIVVVLMIFSLGMKVGEIKGMFESQYGSLHRNVRYGFGPMMYQGGWNTAVPLSGQVMVGASAAESTIPATKR